MRGQTDNHPLSAALLIILQMTLLSLEAPEPTLFLSSGWPYPSFYLSIFASPLYVGFLDVQNLFFLVLICLTSIWLLDQPKEPLKGRGKFFLPNTAKRVTFASLERGEGRERKARQRETQQPWSERHRLHSDRTKSGHVLIYEHTIEAWGMPSIDWVNSHSWIRPLWQKVWNCPNWPHE